MNHLQQQTSLLKAVVASDQYEYKGFMEEMQWFRHLDVLFVFCFEAQREEFDEVHDSAGPGLV